LLVVQLLKLVDELLQPYLQLPAFLEHLFLEPFLFTLEPLGQDFLHCLERLVRPKLHFLPFDFFL